MAGPSRRNILITSTASIALAGFPALAQDGQANTEWRNYGGDLANTRYSPLDQINAGNFSNLEVAWRFKPDLLGPRPEYQYEATPLVIKGGSTPPPARAAMWSRWMPPPARCSGCTAKNEGERGAQRAAPAIPAMACPIGPTARKNASSMSRPATGMIALDAHTGIPVKSFGDNGVVDLKQE